MKAPGKGARTRRQVEEVSFSNSSRSRGPFNLHTKTTPQPHPAEGNDPQATVSAQKKPSKTLVKSQRVGNVGNSEIGGGPPGPNSAQKNRSMGVKRQLEDEELDEVEGGEGVQSHGNDDRFDGLDEEEVLLKKVRRVEKHAPPSFDGGSSPEPPRSPLRLMTGQKQKHRAVQDQSPTPGITQARQTSSQFRQHPRANAQAHRTQRQPGAPLSSTDQHRHESGTTRQERGAVNSEWTHIAKVYGMELSPWITEPELDRALCYRMGQDIPEDDDRAGDIARLLDGYGFGDDVRKDKQFRANFLLGLRQLRSEAISSLSRAALEILGLGDTPEHTFRDQTFDKSEHPGFLDLLDNNKFLGTGDNYLCSDPIIKGLRVFLRGPGSIQFLKNTSRSRINRYGFTTIPAALIPFTATVIYFILRGSGSFEYDPEGDEEYELFFRDRCREMAAFGRPHLARLYNHLDEEVFGVKRKEATAEQKRQREFSKRRLEEIRARAAEEGEQGTGDEQGGSGSKN